MILVDVLLPLTQKDDCKTERVYLRFQWSGAMSVVL